MLHCNCSNIAPGGGGDGSFNMQSGKTVTFDMVWRHKPIRATLAELAALAAALRQVFLLGLLCLS